MPTIYDNIDECFLEGLKKVLGGALSASFCVGYLHLWGWRLLGDLIDQLPGSAQRPPCRILVGMHRPPEEIMAEIQSLKGQLQDGDRETIISGSIKTERKRRVVEAFKRQLEFGIPTAEAESTLRHLARQLRSGKVHIKSYLRHPLHAKLYLVERVEALTPLVGFVGSSNFTRPGLTDQGELNVDVVDQDAARKLLNWFDTLWNDNLAVDLSKELAELIEHSWAGQENIRPYLIYLKIAYHLSKEAREGEREFKLPAIFEREGTPLLDFQVRAVSLAARYLYRRGGVLLGDVVGLGKTLMAIAIARILQEDDPYTNTLVICPPKLIPMWEDYIQRYQITGQVLSLGEVHRRLHTLPRYRLLIIDESHNLRNREGKRYKAILDYIERNEPRVLLLTATPFNKHYQDLSNQIRLFVDENEDLLIRPEKFFQEWARSGKTEADFRAQYQALPTSLRAFEQSAYPEDWQDLMRLFLVRRTRSFIMRNYAQYDQAKQRYYVLMNGAPFYFPVRQPRTVKFRVAEKPAPDQYAQLFSERTVQILENLYLPRYGLAQYLIKNAEDQASAAQKRIIANLTRAGRRLIGFCRTNFFKRLESSGHSFLLSVRRHILRNLVTLYALENRLEIPIGVQDVASMDTALEDRDADDNDVGDEGFGGDDLDLAALEELARQIYDSFRQSGHRFQWLDSRFFTPSLKKDLKADIEALQRICDMVPTWHPQQDEKLRRLVWLLKERHPNEKVLIFTQFADTARYLGEQLRNYGIKDLEIVTAGSKDPVAVARRFSPESNGGLQPGETELRVLVATDVLAEGQNLQDCHIVVNYDLPWAIIRLIQRAGRVDRIGQKHDTILVYSFLPAEGIEKIIQLRQRLFERLRINQEVIGTDESFFGEKPVSDLRDLYAEKPGVLDHDESDEDIDLASLALQVWNSASEADRKAALSLPPLVSSTAPLQGDPPPGMVAYLQFAESDGNQERIVDAMVRVDEHGQLVSQSLSAIFRAVTCAPDTLPVPRHANHYELICQCVANSIRERKELGGQLGSLRSTARKVYERLRRYRDQMGRSLGPPRISISELTKALDQMFNHPLKESAREALRRQLALGISDEALAEMVINLYQADELCQVTQSQARSEEPHIVCALGLRNMADITEVGA